MVTARWLGRPLLVGAAALAVVAATVVVGTDDAAAKPSNPAERATLAAQKLVSKNPTAIHPSAGEKYVAQPVISVPEGLQYVPYLRTYKGLKVVGGDFVVATNSAGKVLTVSAAQTKSIGTLSTTPRVGATEARGVAGKRATKLRAAYTPHLVVHAHGTPRLAWESRVVGTGPAGKQVDEQVYVDADDGKVLGSRTNVLDGTGEGAYNGPNPLELDTDSSGGTYYLRSPDVSKMECRDYGTGKVFSGSDDKWGNGRATDVETGCVDGLFAMQQEKAMLKNWLGRDGVTDKGWLPLNVGWNAVNAQYYLTLSGRQVRIGHNGSGEWLSSIDVVAHEFGHGIDDHTPGGISGGGTQEFIADVYGSVTEVYANEPKPYDTPDYEIGETVDINGDGPIRVMYDPSKEGDPNCFSNSVPNMEVHEAAGPGNHWFYLLAEGSNPSNGQPSSPTCNGSTIDGLGTKAAMKILYNAMLLKTSSASYPKYRTWTLTAAKNLWPDSCDQFNTVKAAWNAVDVPAQSADPTC